MNGKEQTNAIRDLFFEVRVELAKDTESIQYKTDQKPIDAGVICLFCSITTHLKSLELLYAHDLALEADVLLRSCLESVFWMGALINRPESVEDMENEFNYQRHSVRKNILEADSALLKLDPEIRRQMELAQLETKVKRKDRISIFEVARRAELTEMYIPFSNLSNSAAHTTICASGERMGNRSLGAVEASSSASRAANDVAAQLQVRRKLNKSPDTKYRDLVHERESP